MHGCPPRAKGWYLFAILLSLTFLSAHPSPHGSSDGWQGRGDAALTDAASLLRGEVCPPVGVGEPDPSRIIEMIQPESFSALPLLQNSNAVFDHIRKKSRIFLS